MSYRWDCRSYRYHSHAKQSEKVNRVFLKFSLLLIPCHHLNLLDCRIINILYFRKISDMLLQRLSDLTIQAKQAI